MRSVKVRIFQSDIENQLTCAQKNIRQYGCMADIVAENAECKREKTYIDGGAPDFWQTVFDFALIIKKQQRVKCEHKIEHGIVLAVGKVAVKVNIEQIVRPKGSDSKNQKQNHGNPIKNLMTLKGLFKTQIKHAIFEYFVKNIDKKGIVQNADQREKWIIVETILCIDPDPHKVQKTRHNRKSENSVKDFVFLQGKDIRVSVKPQKNDLYNDSRSGIIKIPFHKYKTSSGLKKFKCYLALQYNVSGQK